MRWRFVLSVAAFLAVSLASATATTLQDEYLAIYVKMNDAAKLQIDGDDRGALAEFEDCYNRLERIHRNEPGWESALVLTRMGDCHNYIVALEKKLAPQTKPAPAVASAPGQPPTPKELLAAAQAAARASPNSAAAQTQLGVAFLANNQSEFAVDPLQRAVMIEPNNPVGHNFLGCALLRSGFDARALPEFQKAIALDDNFALAHYNLALLFATQDPPQMAPARVQYRRAVDLGLVPDKHLEHVMRAEK